MGRRFILLLGAVFFLGLFGCAPAPAPTEPGWTYETNADYSPKGNCPACETQIHVSAMRFVSDDGSGPPVPTCFPEYSFGKHLYRLVKETCQTTQPEFRQALVPPTIR